MFTNSISFELITKGSGIKLVKVELHFFFSNSKGKSVSVCHITMYYTGTTMDSVNRLSRWSSLFFPPNPDPEGCFLLQHT